MIPTFKEYLKESVWMDIHKHSTGDAERKEESIDLLDGDEFWEYLKDHYISYNSRHIIQGPFLENIISMPFMMTAARQLRKLWKE